MRALLGLSLVVGFIGAAVVRQSGPASSSEKPLPGKFTDVTSFLGVDFNYLSSHTPKHYLVETMGGGVAIFDYDNDGRLDIFLVNAAPLKAPTTKASLSQYTGNASSNHHSHR